jgi:heme exporter protein A
VSDLAVRLIVSAASQRRGDRLLFQDLSFEVAAGEALVLRGANGAGKTTLLRTIAGLLQPASGTITLSGAADGIEVGERAHYIGHANAIKGRLSVRENLAFWASFLGGPPDISLALEKLGLMELADVPANYLSAGQKRRLGLARLVAAPRPLWLLDEPTVSLDQESRERFASLMRAHLDTGRLIIAATHVDLGLGTARTLELAAAPAETWDRATVG